MNLDLGNLTARLRPLWDELVERRLWPLAIALVVAIAAVPVVLSKPAKQPAPVQPTAVATGNLSSPLVAFQPAVSTAGRKSSEIRKRLRQFKRKNPFTPQGLNLSGGGSAGTAQPSDAGTLGGSVGSSSSPAPAISGSTGGGSTGTSTGSSGSTGPTTQTFYYTYTVDVRFGKTGQEDAKTLTEFRALPGTDNPVVVFMGVRPDGKTSVFLVSASASTTGDGTCKPSDTECTFLYMKKGNSQTIEAVDADGAITDYTLELKDINVKRTTAPQKPSSSSATGSAQSGRTRLRQVVNRFQTFGF